MKWEGCRLCQSLLSGDVKIDGIGAADVVYTEHCVGWGGPKIDTSQGSVPIRWFA